MIRSLRSRHLVNGIIMIIIGLLALGALLSNSIYQSKAEATAEELERTAFDLLGYIEYHDSSFAIMAPNQSDSDVFLDEQKLRTSGKKRFAYLWNATQQKIVWDSLDNDDVDQQEVKNNFALFDFEALLQAGDTQGQGFVPAKAQKAYSLPAEGEQPMQYMVAAQKFAMNVDGAKNDYLFVVATSIADIKSDAYELIKMLLMLLLITAALLIISQLILTWWVVSPIKKFEQEVLDIASGKKSSLENHYPNELNSMQVAINDLIKRGGK